MSQKADALIAEQEHRAEPGLGLALLTVLVMLLVTAVLGGLIYILMIAISPIDQRTPRSARTETPAVQQPAPGIPAAEPTAPAAPAPAK